MENIIYEAKKLIRNNLGVTIDRIKPTIINEAVNLDKDAIFIAVPKTGSTSIRAQIKQNGDPIIPNHHLTICQIRDLIYVYLLKTTLGNNYSFPTKEVPEDWDLRKRAKEIFDSCFKFSAVRNPWARAVSLYFRNEGVPVKNKISFEEFCEQHLYASDTCVHPTLNKNQCDWHFDENGQNLMDYVFKIENFREAIIDIKELTNGKIDLKELNKNRNPYSQSNNYREMYTDYTKKLIAKRFEKDIDVFNYTF